jgi:hypothetical protein
LRHLLISRTNGGTLAAIALGLTVSLTLASSAYASSAGDEYLPDVPSAGASSSGDPYGVDKSALDFGSSGASSRSGSHSLQAASGGQQAGDEQQPVNGKRQQERKAKGTASKRAESAVLTSDQDGTGGDGSGSILLSPLVLLMIGAVIAAAVGMTLNRNRRDDSEGEGDQRRQGSRGESTGPRTPEGEITAGPDQAA